MIKAIRNYARSSIDRVWLIMLGIVFGVMMTLTLMVAIKLADGDSMLMVYAILGMSALFGGILYVVDRVLEMLLDHGE